MIFLYTQLNVKTVLFQTIQFSISMQLTSIWPIDMILSDVANSSESGPALKLYSAFPKAPVFLEPDYQI